jgi:DNA invertase Pin-like site-specific DNA recombinase
MAAIAQAPAMTAATYERVSTRVQGQSGFSLIAQRQSGEEFARAQGWQLLPDLQFRDGDDANASGADWDLPGLTAMMEAARRREFQVLIVPDLDRFARSMVKGLVLEEQLRKYGVRVVYQRVPTDDTPEGNLLKHQLLSFAEYERAKTTLRTTLGRRTKAQAGQVVGNGGTAPYGHRFVRKADPTSGKLRVVSFEPDPITGPIAARIVRMGRTMSTWETAEALNAEGIPSPGGKRWTSVAVRRVLTDRTHIGEWQFSDITVPVAPLIAEPDNRTPTASWLSEWTAAQEALAGRYLVTGPRVSKEEDPFLLRRLMTCGHCGSTLRSSSNGKSVKHGWKPIRYYACNCHAPTRARQFGKPVCPLPDVPAIPLEDEAWRVVTETLLDPDMLAAGLDAAQATHAAAGRLRLDRLETVDAEIAKHRRTLDGLAEKFTASEAGEFLDAIMRRAKELEATIARLTKERAALTANPGPGLSDAETAAIFAFAESARLGIEEATPAERRQLFETLRLRGRVLADPDGMLLGRQNRFKIHWEAKIPLLHAATGLLKREDA